MEPVLVRTRRRTARTKPTAIGPANGLALVRTKDSAEHADPMARRDRLVLENLPLVKAIAVRVREMLPVHVNLNELVHAGILGLCDAANKFDPEEQAVFSRYAKHRVKAAMLDWASREVPPAVQASGSRPARPLFDAVLERRLRPPRD